MRPIAWLFAASLASFSALSAAQEPAESAPDATPVPEASQVPAHPPPPPPNAITPYYPPPHSPWVPAPDEPRAVRESESDERRWYGWQTFTADGVALGLLLLAAGSATRESGNETGTLVGLSGATYLFAAPVIHATHGRVGMSFASAGVRVALPIGGMLAGLSAADCGSGSDEMFCGMGEAVVGFSIGVLSAVLIDGALFAWESPPERAESANRVRVVPAVAPIRGGASAGVLGTF